MPLSVVAIRYACIVSFFARLLNSRLIQPLVMQETIQEKTTIEEFFEPFEIQWLLAYIYFPCKHSNHLNSFPGLGQFFATSSFRHIIVG